MTVYISVFFCYFVFFFFLVLFLFLFFFFSSRRRHTRYWRDWSSDVCSSDLRKTRGDPHKISASTSTPCPLCSPTTACPSTAGKICPPSRATACGCISARSEERRVGKECRSRWSTYQ